MAQVFDAIQFILFVWFLGCASLVIAPLLMTIIGIRVDPILQRVSLSALASFLMCLICIPVIRDTSEGLRALAQLVTLLAAAGALFWALEFFEQPSNQTSESQAMPKDLSTAVIPTSQTRTAMENASAVRNPIQAIADTFATNAQIKALENSVRLAVATGRAAEAESQGLAALIERDDRLIEIRARSITQNELQDNKIEEVRERLKDDLHKRTLAEERRYKERLEAQRETTRAHHGLEAEEVFKGSKFALGERRMRARLADVDVGTATAKTAIRKVSQESIVPRKQSGTKLQRAISNLKRQIVEDEAEGKNTEQSRAILKQLET